MTQCFQTMFSTGVNGFRHSDTKKGTKDYDLNWSATWSDARLEITIDVRFNSFKGFFRKRIIERKLFEMSRKVEVLGWLRYKYWNFHQIWHFEILYLYKNIVMLSFIEWKKFHLQNITEKTHIFYSYQRSRVLHWWNYLPIFFR